MADINITGIDKAELLVALYNRARVQGMGIIHAETKDMTVGEAKDMIDRRITRFDYLKGRVMKIDLSGDFLRSDLYDRDNGSGAVEEIVSRLRN